MEAIPSGSVDMILCDLPYGTTACAWDAVIPFPELWAAYERVIKPGGVIALTAAQPFTSALVMSNPKMFRYELIWDKQVGKAPGVAKFRPMPSHESILIFAKGKTTYNPQMTPGEPYVNRRTADRQRDKERGHKLGYSGVFEIVNKGERYPLSVIPVKFAPIPNALHPTQKPVALFEWLIKTYSNPGELILDNCSGSGTTAEAAIRTGRRFICIEKDPHYVEVSRKRIAAP